MPAYLGFGNGLNIIHAKIVFTDNNKIPKSSKLFAISSQSRILVFFVFDNDLSPLFFGESCFGNGTWLDTEMLLEIT